MAAFALAHPWLTFWLALLLGYPLVLIPHRIIRSRNVKNAGWPPEHLDADGDYVKLENR